jgi:hypothetical protein
MQKYLSVKTQAAGVARIHRKTGRIRWEQNKSGALSEISGYQDD